MIKAASFNVETYLFTPWTITLIKMKFYGFHQQKGTLLTKYHNSFQNVRSLLIHCKANMSPDEGTVKWMAADQYNGKASMDIKKAQLEMLCTENIEQRAALIFIHGDDRSKYGVMIKELQNSYLSGNDNYLSTVSEAYN